MAYILPDDPNAKVTISKPDNGRLIYKTVAAGTVVAAQSGEWELAQIDMTRKTACGTSYNFEKIFRMRVNEVALGGAFSDGFSDGFEID